jgi:hypothetical protein
MFLNKMIKKDLKIKLGNNVGSMIHSTSNVIYVCDMWCGVMRHVICGQN